MPNVRPPTLKAVTYRLPRRLLDAISHAATVRGESTAQFVREALEEAVDTKNPIYLMHDGRGNYQGFSRLHAGEEVPAEVPNSVKVSRADLASLVKALTSPGKR